MIGIACFKIQNNLKRNMITSVDGSSILTQLKINLVLQHPTLEFRQYMTYSVLILEMFIKL